MAAAVEAGSKDIAMSISPSFRSCCCTDWFSGKLSPPRHRFGRSASVPRPEGAVVAAKASSVIGCCSTEGSGASSISACFRKVAPMKFDGSG